MRWGFPNLLSQVSFLGSQPRWQLFPLSFEAILNYNNLTFQKKKKCLWLFGFPAALKEKGNNAFSQGDYASAVQNYTEGLKKQKDMPALYTNRAQVSVPACIPVKEAAPSSSGVLAS